MKNDIELINLTGNDIRVILSEGDTVLPRREGESARVYVTREQLGELDNIPIVRSVKSEPVGMPEPRFNTYYIVSKVVADKLKELGRTEDILVPDEIVKGAKGEIIGCKSLSFA